MPIAGDHPCVKKSHDEYSYCTHPEFLAVTSTFAAPLPPDRACYLPVFLHVLLSAVGRLRIAGRGDVGPAVNPSLPRVPVSVDTDACVVGGRGGGVRGCVVRHCHVPVRVGVTVFANGMKLFLRTAFSCHAHTKESMYTF